MCPVPTLLVTVTQKKALKYADSSMGDQRQCLLNCRSAHALASKPIVIS